MAPIFNVRIDVHGDLRAVVTRQFLHHLGVHAVHGEQDEIGMPELMEGKAFQSKSSAVVGPPRAERGQVQTGSAEGRLPS